MGTFTARWNSDDTPANRGNDHTANGTQLVRLRSIMDVLCWKILGWLPCGFPGDRSDLTGLAATAYHCAFSIRPPAEDGT